MILFSILDLKRYVSWCINGQEIVTSSLEFLEEYTVISNVCHKLLIDKSLPNRKRKETQSNIFNIPTDLINIIINYVVKKADPQEILEICINNAFTGNHLRKYFSIQCYNFKQLNKFIVEGWDINKLGYYYKKDINKKITPLMFACNIRNYNLIRFLLTEGANTNIDDEYGNNVLFYVLAIYIDFPNALNNGVKIFRLLENHGTKLNIKNNWNDYGITPEYLKKYGIIA